MNVIYLDLSPAYIPFLVQCTTAAGAKSNPTVDALIIYEEGGADATFDSTTITGSPFDPAQINSKTGLWGSLVAKSALTAGKWYLALWEMTVDGVTTAKIDRYFACNASSFRADVSGLATAADLATVDGIADAIKLKTDNLPLDPADQSAVEAAINVVAGYIDTEISTIIQHLVDIKGAGWTTETLKAIKEAVAASAISATNQTTITVQTAGGTPIPDVGVTIKNSAQTATVRIKRTDANGQVVIALDDGSYKILLSLAGYTFTVPETLTVSGTTAKTCIGTAIDIGAPADSDACRVYDFCFEGDGSTPVTSVTAEAKIISLPYDKDGKLHSGDVIPYTYDSATGKIYWDIAQGAVVSFMIKEFFPSPVIKTVPAEINYRLKSIPY